MTRRAGGISSPPALLAAHLRAVETAPEGRRRVTLYGAARGIARMVTAGAITEADARAALTAAGLAAAADRTRHPRRHRRRVPRRRSRRMMTDQEGILETGWPAARRYPAGPARAPGTAAPT